ncbi:hypothetical protein JHK84_046369 [Glycine max]|nr:hypothetical protein JHK84_046369 [Glycine max]
MENRGYACNTKVGSAMDVDHCQQKEEEEEQEDPFLKFVDYARSELLSLEGDRNKDDDGSDGLGWSWIVSRILKTCIAYSSGVTPAILLSELSQAWSEQRWVGAPKKPLELINHLKKNHRRTKLPNTVTIDSIYAKNFLSLNSVLEAVIIDAFVLPGLQNGILKRGREIFLTGCYLRTATGGSGHPRLLPTEYLVILLDENQDDDAMLLGAQFCSDPFSSISLDAVNRGASYSLYARVGSMLALDKPYVNISVDCDTETSEDLCLEYGSETQLYLVPYIQHEEQVCVTLTPNRRHGSRPLGSFNSSQDLKFSQVSLPRDSQGTIDFSNYPFRSFVVDLRIKMTGISLYGAVTDIIKEENNQQTISDRWVECSFCRTISDAAVVRTFHLKITLADKDTGTKVLAWCTGQTAMDLLQISPEEFYELPEDEQVMYPSSLENERFMVALVNCKRDGCVIDGLSPDDSISWEITRACKCE